MLDAVHRNVLERPQRAHGRLLRLGHSLNPRDIESLVGPIAPQHPQLVPALEIPYLDSAIIAATGQSLAIRAHSYRPDSTRHDESWLAAPDQPTCGRRWSPPTPAPPADSSHWRAGCHPDSTSRHRRGY